MAKTILSVLFWLAAAGLVALAVLRGGAALLVPAAALVTVALFALDLYLHRRLVACDRDLATTLLHVLSAVVFATSCLYWLVRILLPDGGRW